jgi:DNA-binding phage protein
MDRNNLESLLRESVAEVHECTPFCPDDHGIAAYVDGMLDEAARSLVDRHLADCQACVNRVGLLANLVDDSGYGSEQTHASAGTRAAPRWAIAASVLLAVGLTNWFYQQQLLPVFDASDDFQETRNTSSTVIAPELLAPSSIVIEGDDDFVFRWTEVPGSLYYDVRIVSEVGDLVGVQRIKTTEWRLDRNLRLEPGRDYFIRIDAYQADIRPVSSDHLLFRLRE